MMKLMIGVVTVLTLDDLLKKVDDEILLFKVKEATLATEESRDRLMGALLLLVIKLKSENFMSAAQLEKEIEVLAKWMGPDNSRTGQA